MLSNEPFLWRSADADLDHACLLLHGLGGGIYELQGLAERLLGLGLTLDGFNCLRPRPACPRMPRSSWTEWYG
ncbi:MAG: hypothetical protein ACUVRV_07145 [Cyanobacteriota bacterium]